MKNTVLVGKLTELKSQLALTRLGFDVYAPIGDGSVCDLVAIDRNRVCNRIQVKTSRKQGGFETFNAYSMKQTRSKHCGQIKSRYTKDDIDYFVTIDSSDRLYYIPVEKVTSLSPRLHLFEGYII